jgi:putative solute:sodium symporter small subunit
MDDLQSAPERQPRVRALKLGLLLLWAGVAFGTSFFARALDFSLFGWRFGYWFAAQGALLAFIAIVAGYAWAMNRLAPEDALPPGADET